MIMTESEMDEQLDMIEDFWEEQERAEDEYDARQAEIEEAYQQGARAFAEWLCGKYSRMKQDSIGFEKFQNIYWKSVDEVLAEWEEGEENE